MKNQILVILLFSGCILSAQAPKQPETIMDTSASMMRISDYKDIWNHQFQNSFSENTSLLRVPSATLSTCSPNYLPGLFCKMEYKIETKSKLAPRFRLGSLNYTNWMEGKGSIYSRYWN